MNIESKKILDLYRIIQENKEIISKTYINEITLTAPLDSMPKVNHGFDEKRGRRLHGGVDLGCKVGTEVKSIADGKVAAAGALDDKCGDGVSIDHADGFRSSYCHLSAIKTKVGDLVKQGQIIGLSGGKPGAPGAGNSKGPHLHLTLKKNGERVDPMDYIDKTISPPQIQSVTPSSDENNSEVSKVADKIQDKASEFLDLKGFQEKWGDKFRKAYEKAAFGLAEQEIQRIKKLLK